MTPLAWITFAAATPLGQDQVDLLGWAASPREVHSWLRSPVAGDDWRGGPLPEGDRFATEVEVVREGRRAFVHLRHALVWTHRGGPPVGDLVLRSLVLGDSAYVTGALVGVWIEGQRAPARAEGGRVRVQLPGPVRKGEVVRLLLEIRAELPWLDPRLDLPGQLGARGVGVLATHEEGLTLGHLLPIVADRDAQGFWDARTVPAAGELPTGALASGTVLLRIPAGMQVASTGVVLEEWEDSTGKAVLIGATGVRDFAAVVGRFAQRRRQVGGSSVVATCPSQQPEICDFLLDAGAEALGFLEEKLGPRLHRELDLVSCPLRQALGYEFPGLGLVDTHYQSGVWRPNAALEVTLAHEIAHQWWYQDVGSDGQREPWIDEALASATAVAYWEARYGREAALGLLEFEFLKAYEQLASLGLDDLPADLPGSSYDPYRYAAVIYGKAPMAYDLWRQVIGADAWWSALRDLARAFRGRRLDREQLEVQLGQAPDGDRLVRWLDWFVHGSRGPELPPDAPTR